RRCLPGRRAVRFPAVPTVASPDGPHRRFRLRGLPPSSRAQDRRRWGAIPRLERGGLGGPFGPASGGAPRREERNSVPVSWTGAGEPDPTNALGEPGPERRASRGCADADLWGFAEIRRGGSWCRFCPHTFYGHPLKLSGVSLPLHFAVPFPAKCAHPACLSSTVPSKPRMQSRCKGHLLPWNIHFSAHSTL